MSELLFSYGTLRQPEVQLATFGREIVGYVDAIVETSALTRKDIHEARIIRDAGCPSPASSGAHLTRSLLRPKNPTMAKPGGHNTQ